MATTNFTKLINIKVDDKSINELEKSIKEIDAEILSIQKNEVKLNNSLAEQTRINKELLALTNKRAEADAQRLKVQQAGLTETEKQEQAEKELAKIEADRAKAQKISDKEKADAQAKLDKDTKEASEKTAKALENQQQKAEKLFKVADGIGGSFQVAAGASALFGEKTSEAMEEAQLQVLGLISFTDGIKKVAEGASNAYKLISSSTKVAETASKAFSTTTRIGIAATGIGLFLIALGLVVTYFDDIKKVASEFADSIGLSEIIKQFTEFSDKVGGISGFFTIIKETAVGLVKDLAQVGKAFASLLSFDSDKISAEFGKIGDETGKAFVAGQTKAIANADRDRLIKAKETALKIAQQEIDILKAQGKDTLELEKKVIEDTLALNKIKISTLEKDSDEYLKIVEDNNKLEVALEANKVSQINKLFDSNLKNNQKNLDRKAIQYANDYKKGLKNQEQYNQAIYDAEVKALQKQIDLTKKHGDDTTALERTLAEKELANKLSIDEKKIEADDKAREAELEALELNNLKRIEAIEEDLIKENLTNKEYKDALLENDKKFLQEQLDIQKEGSKEALQAQIAVNENTIKEDKETADELQAIKEYELQQEIDKNNKIGNSQKKNFKERQDSLEKAKNLQIALFNTQLDNVKKNAGEESLEYKKLADAKKKYLEDYNISAEAAAKAEEERIKALKKQIEDNILGAVKGVADILNQLDQQAIADSQKRLDSFTAQNDAIQQQVQDTQALIEASNAKINELEGNLADQRAERSEGLKAELEDERSNRIALAQKNKQLADQQIANEKKVQAEKNRIAELDKQMKKRQQVLGIAEATINTARAVLNALTVQPYPLGLALAISAGVLGATQIGIIASQKFADGGIIDGASHADGGVKVFGGRAELEGGEMIINKRSTALYSSVLHEINNDKTGKLMMEQGGVMPNFTNVNSILQTSNDNANKISTRPLVVSVQEINDVQNRVSVIENSSSF